MLFRKESDMTNRIQNLAARKYPDIFDKQMHIFHDMNYDCLTSNNMHVGKEE